MPLWATVVNPWFWSKNGDFSNIFLLGNKGQENAFYDIQERKIAFLGYKNKNFKKSKNTHFSKRVNPSFWSKNGHFCNFFFLGHIGQKNVFSDILELKNAFLDYKKTSSKSRKNWHLSKRVYPIVLVKKWSFFQIFFFRQYRQGNVVLRFSTAKKCLSRL